MPRRNPRVDQLEGELAILRVRVQRIQNDVQLLDCAVQELLDEPPLALPPPSLTAKGGV